MHTLFISLAFMVAVLLLTIYYPKEDPHFQTSYNLAIVAMALLSGVFFAAHYR